MLTFNLCSCFNSLVSPSLKSASVTEYVAFHFVTSPPEEDDPPPPLELAPLPPLSTLYVALPLPLFPAKSVAVQLLVNVPVEVVEGLATKLTVLIPEEASLLVQVQVIASPAVTVAGLQLTDTAGTVLSNIILRVAALLFKFPALSLANIVTL